LQAELMILIKLQAIEMFTRQAICINFAFEIWRALAAYATTINICLRSALKPVVAAIRLAEFVVQKFVALADASDTIAVDFAMEKGSTQLGDWTMGTEQQ
jgi:hypothetical protein